MNFDDYNINTPMEYSIEYFEFNELLNSREEDFNIEIESSIPQLTNLGTRNQTQSFESMAATTNSPFTSEFPRIPFQPFQSHFPHPTTNSSGSITHQSDFNLISNRRSELLEDIIDKYLPSNIGKKEEKPHTSEEAIQNQPSNTHEFHFPNQISDARQFESSLSLHTGFVASHLNQLEPSSNLYTRFATNYPKQFQLELPKLSQGMPSLRKESISMSQEANNIGLDFDPPSKKERVTPSRNEDSTRVPMDRLYKKEKESNRDEDILVGKVISDHRVNVEMNMLSSVARDSEGVLSSDKGLQNLFTNPILENASLNAISQSMMPHLSISNIPPTFFKNYSPPDKMYFKEVVAKLNADLDRPTLTKPNSMLQFKDLKNENLIDKENRVRRELIELVETFELTGNINEKFQSVRYLKTEANRYGTPMQRLTFFCLHGLISRTKSVGAQLYKSPFRGTKKDLEDCVSEFSRKLPYVQFCRTFVTNAIAENLSGYRRIHIIEVGHSIEGQIQSIISQLAESNVSGKQIFIRYTTINCGIIGSDNANRSLVHFASSLGISLEFNELEIELEKLRTWHVKRKDGEGLAICVSLELHKISASSTSDLHSLNQRDAVMKVLRDLTPRILYVLELETDLNSSSLVSRFRECLDFHRLIFDANDSAFPPGDKKRAILEHWAIGQRIVNVLACEDSDRVVLCEKFLTWKRRILHVGFDSVPISSKNKESLVESLSTFPMQFDFVVDDGVVFLRWKQNPVISLSLWKCDSL